MNKAAYSLFVFCVIGGLFPLKTFGKSPEAAEAFATLICAFLKCPAPFYLSRASGYVKASKHTHFNNLSIHLELRIVELGIEAVARKELLMPAAFDDRAVADDKDIIRMANGRKPMGDNEAGAVAH